MKKAFLAAAIAFSLVLCATPAISGFLDFARQSITGIDTPQEKAARAMRKAKKVNLHKSDGLWVKHITAFFTVANDAYDGKDAGEATKDFFAVYIDEWACILQGSKFLVHLLKNGGLPPISPLFAINDYNVEKKLDDLRDSLPAGERERLAANQEEWLKSGMKKRADELMQAGADRAKAYEKSMAERLETLSDMERSYRETGKIDFDNPGAKNASPGAPAGIKGAEKAAPSFPMKAHASGNFDPFAASGPADSGSSAGRAHASGGQNLGPAPKGMHAGQDHETSTGQLADSSPVEDLRKDPVLDPKPEPKPEPKQDAVFVRQSDKLDFADPEPGDEICGEVVATNKDNVGSIAIIMFAEGEIGAYISDSAACRKAKPKNYLCAMVIDRADTSPEIKESGVTAKSMYNISECRLGK